ASLISLIFLGIACYTKFAYQITNLERANLAALCTVLFIVMWQGLSSAADMMYWVIPLGLFTYIALPLKQARILNIVVLCCFALLLFLQQPLLNAFMFCTSYLLMMAFGGTFAALHQQRSRTLVELAIHEPVTGAYNMRHLEDTLTKEICRSGRTEKPLSMVALEIDYFEQVEDMHGLTAKQQLLQQVADTLQGMIRAGDSQYFDAEQRYYLLLPCTPEEGVLVIAERIRRTIEESSWPTIESITVSLGCCTYLPSKGEKTASEVLQSAHTALAEAHRNGHNRVMLHD
ncbi:hypothetical protein A3744_15620, partial [Oleiphilus sp. HI0073]